METGYAQEYLRLRSSDSIDVYLEIGSKRTFASALDWPGWSRSERDEVAALQSLSAYGPRYSAVLVARQIELLPPVNASGFTIVERLPGSATTDFGAPEAAPSKDSNPVSETELTRFKVILEACWQAFDQAARAAAGRELRKGPRGGGRDLDKIVQHVVSVDVAYFSRLGVKFKVDEERDPAEELLRIRQAIMDRMTSAAHGQLPERGPRGGVFWTPRYFVRRTAWHILDHTWEIEDRVM